MQTKRLKLFFLLGGCWMFWLFFCSQCVPIKFFNGSPSEFPKMSQIAPHFYSMGQRGGTPSFNTNLYFGKRPKFQGFFFFFGVMGQSKWIITNQKKKKLNFGCIPIQLTNTNMNKYPQFIMGVLTQAKNGDQQFWKQKFHVANEKTQLAFKVA